MLKAIKDNKVYDINENQTDFYLSDGFDVYNEDGEVIEYSHLKTIKYSDHLKLLAEASKLENVETVVELEGKLQERDVKIAELENEINTKHTNVMELLKGYAVSKGIEVGSATTAAGVLTKITDAEKV